MDEEKRLCEYGCGQEAKFQLKNRKWCCQPKHTDCMGFRAKVSERLKSEFRKGIRKNPFSGKSWNKGQTKETNPILAELSIRIKNEFLSGKRKKIGCHHTEETKKRLSKCGGIKRGAGRGKNGWYKGYWCDSSWELAWVIYNLDHGIKFERNKQGFEYEFEGKKHRYYPDFILEDGTYVEIKGFMDTKSKAKILQFNHSLSLFEKKQMTKILEYVIGRYGNNFISIYDGLSGRTTDKKDVWFKKEKPARFGQCPQCGSERPIKYKKICLKCWEENRRKNWQLKEVLEKEISEMSWRAIGKKYGVSDVAIKKRAIAYGIIFLPRNKRKE